VTSTTGKDRTTGVKIQVISPNNSARDPTDRCTDPEGVGIPAEVKQDQSTSSSSQGPKKTEIEEYVDGTSNQEPLKINDENDDRPPGE
jgi:hypothetical protein